MRNATRWWKPSTSYAPSSIPKRILLVKSVIQMERSDTSPAGLKEEPAASLDAPPARAVKTFSSLQHRNFQLWFGGQLISVIGTWMQIIAQGWLIYELTHSELYLGLVSFTAAIPLLIVSPWGGVITDRVPKRTLIIITQSTTM